MRSSDTVPSRLQLWKARASAAILLAFAFEPADSAEFSEYDLKALYLYHFTQFVTWPETVRDEGEPIVIGVVGADPFSGRLEPILEQQPANPNLVSVIHVNSTEEARNCHILFISNSEQRNLRRIINAVGDLPILTVGDDSSFALRGCVIGFYTDQNKVRISVNEQAAAEAGLTLSSKLLRIAKI